MKMDKNLNESKIEILIHLHKDQKEELMFRRGREFRIFAWSSAVFIALIGLVIVKPSGDFLWEGHGIGGKIIASIPLFILFFYSIVWQNRERRLGNRNARVVAKIHKLLHCFDKNYFDSDNEQTLFPVEWEKWGQSNLLSKERFLRGNLITGTWFLGILAILAILIS